MRFVNCIKGSSRSRCIMAHPRNNNSVDVTDHPTLNIQASTAPGAKLNTLVNEAVREIISTKRSEPDTIMVVYLIAGIPDITERVCRAARRSTYSWSAKYEEVLFTQNPADACNAYLDKILAASSRISEAGGIPVFCTVAPMSLQKWNTQRLKKRVTGRLLHQHRYGLQQANLDKAILLINDCIQSVNMFNGVATPRLSQEIIKGSPLNGRVRRFYGRMIDGCHVNDKVAFNWANTLHHIMERNIQKFTEC